MAGGGGTGGGTSAGGSTGGASSGGNTGDSASAGGSNAGAVVETVKPGDPAPAGSTATEDATSGDTAASDPNANCHGWKRDKQQSGRLNCETDAAKTDNTQPATASSSQTTKESSSKKKGTEENPAVVV